MIDTAAWPDLNLVEPITEGNRNEVWRGDIAGRAVAVRQSRRSPASLAWELALIDHLDQMGFWVPSVIPSGDGAQSVSGVVVQRWIGGREPTSDEDWAAVAAELKRLHLATRSYPQRPDCCPVAELAQARRSVDADLDAMPAELVRVVTGIYAEFARVATSVIHGDPNASNLRITTDGNVGLLDWDESRVDVACHDLSNLGIVVLAESDQRRAERLSHAWEATNPWLVEPEYARDRLALLQTCLLYTSPSPRDATLSRMPSSA